MRRRRLGTTEPIEKDGRVFHYWSPDEVATIKRLAACRDHKALKACVIQMSGLRVTPWKRPKPPSDKYDPVKAMATAFSGAAPPGRRTLAACPRCGEIPSSDVWSNKYSLERIGHTYVVCGKCEKIY